MATQCKLSIRVRRTRGNPPTVPLRAPGDSRRTHDVRKSVTLLASDEKEEKVSGYRHNSANVTSGIFICLYKLKFYRKLFGSIAFTDLIVVYKVCITLCKQLDCM